MPDFQVTGAASLKALARDLKAAGDGGKVIRKELRKGVVAAVAPMQRDAKAAALAIPTKGPNHTGLRKAISKAIRTRVTISQAAAKVRLEVDPKKMPPDQRRLGILMEGAGRKPWRHPSFGDRDVWVDQEDHPYFTPAVDRHITGVRGEVSKAIDRATEKLRRGTA